MMTTVPTASAVASNEMRMEIKRQRFHAQPEDAGNFFQLEAEEIFYLSAGDEDGNAVGKSNDDGTRNELHRRAHASESHDDENEAGHHGAHEEAIDAVNGNDAGDYNYEGTGGPADLRSRSTQRGDQKASNDGTVNSGLRRKARGNRKSHGQRQGHQTNRDSGNQIAQKFIQAVMAQAED